MQAMAQSLAKILVHVVFSTKERRPFLRDNLLREELYRFMSGTLKAMDCAPVIIGGVEDHVHLLCNLSRSRDAAEVVKELKRSSSLWIKSKFPASTGSGLSDLTRFAWQSGYGIFSVGFSQIPAVTAYIARQEEHHRKTSFQDELRQFLRRYEVEYDERYVWD